VLTPPGDAEDEAALAARLEELRHQLVSTPAEVVVANHAYGLFELAAIHLSQRPTRLDQARLAIDALGALVEGLAGRLGQAELSLVDALAQIRLAYVQIQASEQAQGSDATTADAAGADGTKRPPGAGAEPPGAGAGPDPHG
jgi:hypothetical protein